MGKRQAKVGVGQLELQIVFPEEETNDGTRSTEGDRPDASSNFSATGSLTAPRRKWYSVIDKVYGMANLEAAWAKVKANNGAPGVDGMTVAKFAERKAERLQRLAEDLRAKTYRPQPVRRVYLAKPGGGRRPLGIPTVRDRIVQQAILRVLEPIFEAKFSRHSHGFRPGRGCASALQIVDRAVKHGYTWVVDADIEAFFDSVEHDKLLDAVHEEVTDGSLLRLVRRILEAGVVEPSVEETEPSERQPLPDELPATDAEEPGPNELGTPQGGPLSPLLANIYLHAMDERLSAAKVGLVRYADDFVIFARSEAEASAALNLAREVLEGELGLRLHPEKTRVVAVTAGFEFLGFHWFWDPQRERFRKEVRRKSAQRFRERIREKTPRLKGQRRPKQRTLSVTRLKKNRRLQTIIVKLNRYLRGWHWYYKELWSGYPETPFRNFDGYVRARLRATICGRTGPGWWHRVLKNKVLRELGLESLDELHRAWLEKRLTAPVRKG